MTTPTLSAPQKNDRISEVQDIITVGQFYELAAAGQSIFT